MARRFDGKIVLITGGSRGIGRSCALAFANEGADVAITYLRNSDEAKQTVSSLKESGAKALAFPADTSNSEDVSKMTKSVVSEFGRIDVLVNNAGVLKRTPFLDIPEAEWDWLLGVNLKGYFLVGQSVARHMVDQQIRGVIVNISSNAEERAAPRLAHYDVSKAGVAMLTKCMALELAQYGIRVNAVAPGLIETDMNREDLKDPKYREQRISRIPLHIVGAPDDISGAVLFLASDDAKLATGHSIFLDAGSNI